MALKSPLMPSPSTGLMSAFSPYTDSPTSPPPFRSPVSSNRSSDNSSQFLQPTQTSPIASSPSDVPDPSPIAPSSNGTDGTDIDETAVETEETEAASTPAAKPAEPDLKVGVVLPEAQEDADSYYKLETKGAAESGSKPRSDEDEQPNSVIHAPQGFESFHARRSPPSIRRSTPTPSQRSDVTVISPGLPEESGPGRLSTASPASPPPIWTAVAPARDWSTTPRAQTLPEAEAEAEAEAAESSGRSLQRQSHLEDIPEAQDTEPIDEQTPNHHTTLFDETVERFQETADEVAALKVALSECWTLCNTLAGLSYVHRERIFNFAGKGDIQQQAWKSCWKLCQKLYETRDEDFATQVRPTLDLCREFCQSLFEVRERQNEVADSVLRVSFELNNHLYNTHDRTLPEAFRERTLEFYITLCHRLMKQRTGLAEETDSLLRACWSLAEMLFSLRQNWRAGKPADEELLGSAVQACWELCDLFREGWTQVRPDRGTPRPSQTTFTQAFQQAKQTFRTPPAAFSYNSEDDDFGRLNPETPSTVFEDTLQVSPDDASSIPNILVLGPEHQQSRMQQPVHHTQRAPHSWSSSTTATSASSSLSGGYSHSPPSERTASSTSTIMNPSEDPHLTCLKLLIVKAALITGYQRSSPLSLTSFVKSMSSNSFGTAPWQTYLLEQYKKLVASDPGFRHAGPTRRASARDVSRSVRWMVAGGQYIWLKDLFRLVLGWYVEDGEDEVRAGVVVQS